ncbi:Hypp9346 [Branchiostoma lanceolatum]|uniref:Hypp9346 protein n=1 Tax=Branchiostoma lanceolatum TaxID=7740 RepID=A0A8S4MLE1_BRALA|nr:Hypp9346 [Branchiostoma lanceolatum]
MDTEESQSNTDKEPDAVCQAEDLIITDILREKTANRISSSSYISFMTDGDTDVSIKECEIVYARIVEDGKQKNILVGHEEVEHAHTQDRHKGIDKWIREEQEDSAICCEFKSLIKELQKTSDMKCCTAIKDWMKCIKKHLYPS